MPPIKPGRRAPTFSLLDGNRQKHSLAQYRGDKNVVLAFYILAFTGG
ncbi:MAG: redoxin domain-containing protein [Dehalococcoidia bacterium]